MDASRRRLLVAGGAATLAHLSGVAARAGEPWMPQDLDVRDLSVEGDRALGRRFTLLVPRHVPAGERTPLLVLLHGLGETGDEKMGAWAWLERYGLGTAYDRLRRAPIARTSKRADWTDARLADVNRDLERRPFRGMTIACPYTPNVNRAANPSAALDGYAKWLVEVVVPRARREAAVLDGAKNTALDGCSLGGFVGLEVFLRRPEAFGRWGGVQSAFGAHRAVGYAERIARAVADAGARPIHLLTSAGDPFREGNAALSAELVKRNVASELRVPPGPHDQPWLREAGTIEMLLWHDRQAPRSG